MAPQKSAEVEVQLMLTTVSLPSMMEGADAQVSTPPDTVNRSTAPSNTPVYTGSGVVPPTRQVDAVGQVIVCSECIAVGTETVVQVPPLIDWATIRLDDVLIPDAKHVVVVGQEIPVSDWTPEIRVGALQVPPDDEATAPPAKVSPEA
jgi:hypothetical protein